MKPLMTLSAALLAATMTATGAAAAPYCDALGDRDALPSKHQKRGPFHSDAASGWIIGDDQLRARFEMSAEASLLLSAIREEFTAQGATLAVVAAPPRPLFAPGEALAAMGLAGYDAAATAAEFQAYVKALNAVGVAAPDLLAALREGGEAVYFKRDTHWTPTGAALSAAALADALKMRADAAAPAMTGGYEEKGSLSAVAEAACGARPEAETVAAPDFAKAGGADALLGDAAAGPALALIGTSFSDRYKRDAYRVADAIAHYTGAAVENASISGGGATSAMEAFIRSGRIGEFDVVVWETPYSEPLTNLSALRQILGALKSARIAASAEGQEIAVSREWATVEPEIAITAEGAIELEIDGVEVGQLDVELRGADGAKTRIKLRKSKRVEAGRRSDRWTFALGSIDPQSIDRIKIRLKGAEAATAIMRAL
ncbi:MAG: hypothetical protein AAFN79_07340 [Pseudomonadota bacterium]